MGRTGNTGRHRAIKKEGERESGKQSKEDQEGVLVPENKGENRLSERKKGAGEAPGSGQAGTRLRLPRPRAGQALLGVLRAASPPKAGAPRAAPPDPVSPADTQRHRGQKTPKAPTLPPTDSEPAGTMLRKKQRPGLQVSLTQSPSFLRKLSGTGAVEFNKTVPARRGPARTYSAARHFPFSLCSAQIWRIKSRNEALQELEDWKVVKSSITLCWRRCDKTATHTLFAVRRKLKKLVPVVAAGRGTRSLGVRNGRKAHHSVSCNHMT
ncbi:uncharacterized protein [Physeter macrocephalus]|uniref:Uncharacterized protein n=1 Tax=Physeter macrocephalus TaxID=9755 RepID=A0A9W2X311_PHYMC|nr:uncharacterized protein LOC129392724 [Physeter catodon]